MSSCECTRDSRDDASTKRATFSICFCDFCAFVAGHVLHWICRKTNVSVGIPTWSQQRCRNCCKKQLLLRHSIAKSVDVSDRTVVLYNVYVHLRIGRMFLFIWPLFCNTAVHGHQVASIHQESATNKHSQRWFLPGIHQATREGELTAKVQCKMVPPTTSSDPLASAPNW